MKWESKVHVLLIQLTIRSILPELMFKGKTCYYLIPAIFFERLVYFLPHRVANICQF